MKLPELRIAGLKPSLPIFQGGMAVRLSTHRLAAAVAEAGGVGIIAGTAMTARELTEEIRKARALTKGVIGVNVMYAASAFAELVKTAIAERIDLVVSGAGFSRDMFTWGRESGTPIVPIVSTARLARTAEKLGAAAVVVEGFEAGGHLGTDESMKKIVPEVAEAVSIPVIAAGGIVEAEDIREAIGLGATGVQMGIRFGASEEGNGDDRLKQAYLDAGAEDIILIKSPVGLPGRAIRNTFTEKLAEGRVPAPEHCSKCLKVCSQTFCIREALINAQRGRLDDGIIFSGKYIEKIRDILPVRDIIGRLTSRLAELPAPPPFKRPLVQSASAT
ncbi:MAG: NAD(P)H-dependent flavin oxidoreductase [Bacillota bacterium]